MRREGRVVKKRKVGPIIISQSHTIRRPALDVKQGTRICFPNSIQSETARVSHQNMCTKYTSFCVELIFIKQAVG